MTPIELPTMHRNGWTVTGRAFRPLAETLRDIVRGHEQQATPRRVRVGKAKGEGQPLG